MLKLMTRLATVILALILALPTVGCQQKEKVKQNEKALDVQVDAGKTKVKVEANKKSDQNGRHVDVEVEHRPTDTGARP
jgi:hypothetical protein